MGSELASIFWLGDSLEVVRSWSSTVRRRAGEELFRLQLGNDPVHWRPMASVGAGVREIRIREGRQFRIFYVTRNLNRIVVLHAFEKRSQRTAKSDIETGRRRITELRNLTEWQP